MEPLPPKSPLPAPISSASSESSKTINSILYPIPEADVLYCGQIPTPPGVLVDDPEPELYWWQRKP